MAGLEHRVKGSIEVRYVLGLDIGSHSVGSAWVDLEKGEIAVGCGVFPAGVEESEDKRGAPKNAKRRMARRMRRNGDRKRGGARRSRCEF